jgi:RNA polymerase sigma-70 factor (ECF subfamily)
MATLDTSKQEALWVLRAQCEDREALELLLRSVQPWVHRYLCGLVGPTDADDVLQEVFVLVYRKLTRLDAPELFRPWLLRIASRAAFRRLKKDKRRREEPYDDAVLESFPAPSDRPAEESPGDLRTLEGISPASRAVLVLHFQEELSLADVAAVLGLPLGTVKSRLAYGLMTLRRQAGTSRN